MPVQIVARTPADMEATGAGQVEAIEHTYAIHNALTHEFRISLSKSAGLFSAISWEDINTEGDSDASGGVANYSIALDRGAFAAALKAVIEQAIGGPVTNGFSLSTNVSGKSGVQTYALPSNMNSATAYAQTVLDREVRQEVEGYLNQNNVLEYLEGDSMTGFSLSLDASGGAYDMADKLMANNFSDLRHLLLQIPNRPITANGGEVGATAATGSRLPVADGDAVVFTFNVQPAVKISQVDVTDPVVGEGVAQSGAAANNLATTGFNVGGSVDMTTGNRFIAFVIDVTA